MHCFSGSMLEIHSTLALAYAFCQKELLVFQQENVCAWSWATIIHNTMSLMEEWIKEKDKVFCRCILETCFQNVCPFKALNYEFLYLVITVLMLHCRKTPCSCCPYCNIELFPQEKPQHVEKKFFLKSVNSIINWQSKLLLFLLQLNL